MFCEVGDKWTNCRERERSRENVRFHDNTRSLRASERKRAGARYIRVANFFAKIAALKIKI